MDHNFSNQIEQVNFIKNKFSTYLKSTFDIRDKDYKELYIKRLTEMESKLYKGPFLSSSLPFKQSKSIKTLVSDGVFDKKFLEIEGIDFERPSYSHQVKAFETIVNGRNAVITTGTGSGKTECFMLPIINEIIKETNECKNERGIRAIFLFPLNALVYDQIDRLRNYLKKYTDIKFGFYTGNTPNDNKTNEDKRKIELYKKKFGESADNELLTRQQMKDTPPQILFTNYSMLEYMLIRPSDEALISQKALNKLKFIVLDEAHVYRGALAIEISLLLRRLQGICNKNVQFILTSATLGRGKEDLKEIIDFSSKLTSSKFYPDDIIFGQRIEQKFTNKYKIIGEDYRLLLNNINNNAEFVKIFNKYLKFDNQLNLKTNLYNLLINDENTCSLFYKTKNVCDFYSVLKDLYTLNVGDLTALIELINITESSNYKYATKLFDIKYHMFMKAPDGALITLGRNKDLSLLSVSYINGYKAFKIGICQNCKIPYIMGITRENILCVDDEVDIDESYADKSKILEYYLIKDCLTEEEIYDIENNNNFEKVYVCAKCGFVKREGFEDIKGCEHGNEDLAVLYKYIGDDEYDSDDEDIITNNINRCPICDYKSNNNGVIMGFHVGKDRATTLIAQILYESMNYPIIIEEQPKNSLFSPKPVEKKGRKQFLVFSDSRQQAAFFSKFLNMNNDRFLKKILLWNMLVKNNHEKISYLNLLTGLEEIFRKEFGYSEEEAEKHAKATVLWDLLLVDGRNSGEGIGLFAFVLDVENGNYTREDDIVDALRARGFTNISYKQFIDLTKVLLQIFRTAPAIEYGNLMCDFEEKKELLGYRHRKFYIKLCDEQINKNSKRPEFYPVKSFLPINLNSKNGRIKYVMKCFGYDKEKAIELINIIFGLARDEHLLLENTEKPEYSETYLIDAKKYFLHSYKNLTYFKCKKCNKLTIYNINNKCTEPDCDGELEICDIENDAFYKDNYYRNEYLTRTPEKLICKEHTAQMNITEAKNIQDDFKSKNGRINFISCSTTFEMGIDLGQLSTVFMRNVPPTPANYAQRAGRAGRRSSTSALMLTYCGLSSHDYTFFSNPEEMIRGNVQPPYFTIDNDKIIMRHITAAALSLYFRDKNHFNDFNSVEQFLENDVANKFLDYINQKPKNLGEIIDNFILKDSSLLFKYGNFKWIDYISISESALNSMTSGLKELIELYKEAESFAASNGKYKQAEAYKNARKRLNSPNSLITYFTKYNVIPGYGFPVDNVELYIYNYNKQEMDGNYNLSRDLSIAISEYAPGSEVIVDDKKYTSRYLFLPRNNKSLPKTYYCECNKCHTLNTSVDDNYFNSNPVCKYCGTQLNITFTNLKSYQTPIYGFVADRTNKETRRVKPFKTYASDIYYIGEKIINEQDENSVIKITEHKNEKLLILNENRFYFCPICGYTELDKKNFNDTKTVNHMEYSGKSCSNNRLELTRLGHSYLTDIIKIAFNNVEEMYDNETAISVLYAILEGISLTYNIERNDINGIIYRTNISKPFSLILFDTVSGGAGHVKRLRNDKSLMEVLKNSLVKVSQKCCEEDSSCYNCLRTYNNQRFHKHIKRGKAKLALTNILNKIYNLSKAYNISDPQYDFSTLSIEDFIKSQYFDDETNGVLNNLFNEIRSKKAIPPSGFGYVLTNDGDNSKEYADFYWKDSSILLFSLENKESFDKLVNTQCKYNCYLLSENFDYVKFVEKLLEF